jgi:hypothetical protein
MQVEIDSAEVALQMNDDGAYMWHWQRGDMSVIWSKEIRTPNQAADHFHSVIDAMSNHAQIKLYAEIRQRKP